MSENCLGCGGHHTHTHTHSHTHTHTHTLSLFGIGTWSPCTPVHHNQGSREGRTWGLERAPCKTQHSRDFPAGTVVKTLPPKAGGAGLIPGRGTKIPHALGPKNQNIKQKRNCNTFSKNFKNDPHQKKKILKNPALLFSQREQLCSLPPAPLQTSQPSSWSRRACSPGLLKARARRCQGGTWEVAVAAQPSSAQDDRTEAMNHASPVLSGPTTSCRYHVNTLSL